MRRRRQAAVSGPTKSTASYRPPPVAEWAGPEAPAARLVVIEGPDAGRSVELGERAVTIGADADCALHLSDAGGQVGGRHARVWLREGSFMLHHLDKRLTTRVGERDVDWAVLEHGGRDRDRAAPDPVRGGFRIRSVGSGGTPAVDE